MKVICISGKAGSGKDTTATLMKRYFENSFGKTVLIAHYADLVKYICKTFCQWDGNKDEAGRHLLQYVGTDLIRNEDPDYWVRFISDMLCFFIGKWDYVLIPDCRFPNEIDYLKGSGFDVVTLRINRDNYESPLTEAQKGHSSETALDEYEFDEHIENSGGIYELSKQACSLCWKLVKKDLPIEVMRNGEHKA